MGRPKKDGALFVPVVVKVPPDVVDRLDAAAEAEATTRSGFMRSAILRGLERSEARGRKKKGGVRVGIA